MTAEYALASVAKNAKKFNLKDLVDGGSIIFDPEHPGFQARNLQPLEPEFVAGLKKSGGWDPANPGTVTKFMGKLIVINGNTRARAFHSLGVEEGWFVEKKMLREDDPMELHRLRLHDNNVSESDPWTAAETYADGERRGLTPEEQAIGVSPQTVKKWLRIFHTVRSLGPKPKAEEKPEQTAERLKKAKEQQDAAIAKIRTGELTAGDVLKFFERDLPLTEDFDKAFKALLARKKADKAAQAQAQTEKTLADYADKRIPPKFFPDLIAMIVTSTGLTQDQKIAATATLNMVMGLLPRDKFLAGDFSIPEVKKKAKGEKSDDEDDDEDEADVAAALEKPPHVDA